MEPSPATIVTPRFGEVSFTAEDTIEFPWGLPGFPDLHRFLALSLDEQPGYVWLQSVDDPQTALPAADPWSIFADYEPRLPAYATESLEISQPDEFTLLCIVVVTKNAAEMTMNLLAPVIVNLRTRRARQVMLEASNYSSRTEIPRRTAQGAAQPA